MGFASDLILSELFYIQPVKRYLEAPKEKKPTIFKVRSLSSVPPHFTNQLSLKKNLFEEIRPVQIEATFHQPETLQRNLKKTLEKKLV
ncbi:MAG TPA: hypothetical protein DCM62_05005 [Bacteroidales bacterium]|nr:hypothetical protein [Bacteroidales bacterium]